MLYWARGGQAGVNQYRQRDISSSIPTDKPLRSSSEAVQLFAVMAS
jgi:hypothetical protein